MPRLSGRGTPLRAGSPRCCNDRRPGSGSPHPPHGGGSPIRSGLVRQPEAVGPRSGRITRCIQRSNGSPAHQRGSPARSRHPRPDGLVYASRPNRGWMGGAEAVAMSGTHEGVARLIPYCARPASTAHSDRHLNSILVRDARARGIRLAAPPLCPSSAEAAFP